ncbi:MAG: hypothetical protein ACQEXJ_11615 [Myxococcota bacterium]
MGSRIGEERGPACHLDGVHGGVLRVRGRAPRLTWRVGRDGALVVRGREVVKRAA